MGSVRPIVAVKRALCGLMVLLALAQVPLFPGEKAVFRARDIRGRSWDSAALEGRVILIYFWATWCSVCSGKIPELRSLDESYGARGLEILGVSVDTANRSAVSAYLNRNRIPWPQFHDGRGVGGGLARMFDVQQVPAYVLLSRDGRLLWSGSGGGDLRLTVAAQFAP